MSNIVKIGGKMLSARVLYKPRGTNFTTTQLKLVKVFEPESREPKIPAYEENRFESISVKKARLLYQSRKRGMLENGLLLSTFANKFLDLMTEEELHQYDRLINVPSNDWDLFHWATGIKPVPEEFNNGVMGKFQEHVQNKNKEIRMRQPDLY